MRELVREHFNIPNNEMNFGFIGYTFHENPWQKAWETWQKAEGKIDVGSLDDTEDVEQKADLKIRRLRLMKATQDFQPQDNDAISMQESHSDSDTQGFKTSPQVNIFFENTSWQPTEAELKQARCKTDMYKLIRHHFNIPEYDKRYGFLATSFWRNETV